MDGKTMCLKLILIGAASPFLYGNAVLLIICFGLLISRWVNNRLKKRGVSMDKIMPRVNGTACDQEPEPVDCKLQEENA